MDLSKKKQQIQLTSRDLELIKENALFLFKDKSAPLGYETNNTAFIWIEAVVNALQSRGVELEITYRVKG